jgi:hypothetical protein
MRGRLPDSREVWRPHDTRSPEPNALLPTWGQASVRYVRHAPEAFLDEDAAAIASNLSRVADQEAVADAPEARPKAVSKVPAFLPTSPVLPLETP